MTTQAGWQASAGYEDRVIAALRPRLRVFVAHQLQAGAVLPEPDEVAATMAESVPSAVTASEYDRLIGPFYSSASTQKLLRVPTKQALDDRRKRETILAAMTRDHKWVYPAFQFDVEGHQVLPALRPVLAALKGTPRWGASLWLVTEHPDLHGTKPLDALNDAQDGELVLALAAQYAAATRT